MAEFSNLDRIDRKILAELDRNSRQPAAEISRKLRLGSDIVGYRIERLLKNRVVDRFGAYIDLFRLGKSLYKTYLKLNARRDKIDEFLTFPTTLSCPIAGKTTILSPAPETDCPHPAVSFFKFPFVESGIKDLS